MNASAQTFFVLHCSLLLMTILVHGTEKIADLCTLFACHKYETLHLNADCRARKIARLMPNANKHAEKRESDKDRREII